MIEELPITELQKRFEKRLNLNGIPHNFSNVVHMVDRATDELTLSCNVIGMGVHRNDLVFLLPKNFIHALIKEFIGSKFVPSFLKSIIKKKYKTRKVVLNVIDVWPKLKVEGFTGKCVRNISVIGSSQISQESIVLQDHEEDLDSIKLSLPPIII
jgi:hypothetical protein